MKLAYVTCDVFTDVPFGGNQLAVFPDADGVPDALMQRIARELNLAETVFVQRSARHTCRVRIFTPARELPFAGHPTVGAACVLSALDRLGGSTEIVFEEGVGPVPVSISGATATLTAAQLPEVTPAPVDATQAAELLGLAPAEVIGEPCVVSCGVPFVLVPLHTRAALGHARLRLDAWDRLLGHAAVRELYPVTRDAIDGFDLQVRMFAPAFGIPEDPATGGAAAAVAGWLAQSEPRDGRTLRWTLAQGFEMGRPSRLVVEADTRDGAVSAVRVSGQTVLMARAELELP